MPRSSRHKSNKHSSREARDYSDSEKDPGMKEKRGRDDGGGNSSSRHVKESTSGEKRKLESKSVDITKDSIGAANADYIDGFAPSSSKKRKEKVDDDRWTGGDNEPEFSKSEIKEMKSSGDSRRSSRRDENIATGFDGDEGKRSGTKVESKAYRSDRKERSEKEGASERERKGSKSERSVDGVLEIDITGNEGNRKQGSSAEERGGKSVGNADFNVAAEFREPEPDRELDRRARRKRDDLSDGDRHQDGLREQDNRRLSSKEDVAKSAKYKDDGHKDERTRDKYREDVDKDHFHQDERQNDTRYSRESTRGKSDDKHLRNEKKDLDMLQKKSKPHGGDYDRDRDRERDRDRGRDRDRDMDHDRSRERDRDHDRDRDRDHGRHDRDRDRDRDHDGRNHDHDRDRDLDRDVERAHDRDHELDWDRERGRDRYRRERERDRIRDDDRNRDRSRDRDYDHDHDYGSHIDEKGSRYKEDRGRRRSPDAYDDFHGDKSRRVESDADKEKSLSRKAHIDSVTSGSRRRGSPSSRSYVSTDKYRDGLQDDMKHGDSLRDCAFASETNKLPKYRSGEKRGKFDDNHIGELPERSPGTKASPAGLKERSPSTTSVDRRFRTLRSLDVDEAERRSSGSNDVRDVSVNEDRHSRDFSAKKHLGEEYPRAETSFHHKSGQINVSSHGPSSSGFRAGADSPSFIGSAGDDNRGHSGGRYRRGGDPNVGRGPGNAWKGVPNWPSPLPNGFMPFPPGPPGPHHGGFPPMLSQFPPLFGVRPPLELNHPGIPYHMADADRFAGHVRPMGWQNMVDGSIPPHFHGWDANNGVLRDESAMYGPGHLSGVRGRDINEDMWKPNGNINTDATSGSQKDPSMLKASTDEASSAQATPRGHQQSSCADDQGMGSKMNAPSDPLSAKEFAMSPAKVTTEKTPESFSADDMTQYLRAYLVKLDISIDMADPELYNQCINIAIKGKPDYPEEDDEVEHVEEKVVAATEYINLTLGPTIFPAAKDSVFQRALRLYKTQSNERSTATMRSGEELHSLPTEMLDVEQTMHPTEIVDTPVDHTVKQEDSTPVVAEVVPPTGEEERMETAPITSEEVLNAIPSPQSASLALDVGDEQEMLVLDVQKLENISGDSVLENDDAKGHLPVESTYSEGIASSAEIDMLDGDASKIVGIEPASDELLDVTVSKPLNLCNDSVKVCEVLTPLSNDPESVILSRIHDAPESTH